MKLASPFFPRVLAALASCAPALAAQGAPEVFGLWDGPFDWRAALAPPGCPVPDEIAHAALIPHGPQAGKVLLWNWETESAGCGTVSTTRTWIWDPEDPATLTLIEHPQLASQIFCSGLSWDPDGNLIVAGGVASMYTPSPTETYRFVPAALPAAATGTPPRLVAPGAWVSLGLMGVERFYPTLVPLNRWTTVAPGSSGALSAAHLILGGPPTITQEGNEVWELLPRGAFQWTDPLIPEGGPWPHFSPSWPSFETYVLEPAPPPAAPAFALLDSYPRALQLSAALHGQVFIAGDVDTSYGCPPAGNPKGAAWVVDVPYGASLGAARWQLQLTDQPSGIDRLYGSAALQHTLLRADRVLVFGGAEFINAPCTGGTPTSWRVEDSVQEFEPGFAGGASAVAGKWHSKVPMLAPRVFLNAVALPTGEFLLTGGDRRMEYGGASPQNTVFRPELYSPGADPTEPGSTRLLAQSNLPPQHRSRTPRRYHHLAVLLPSGSVLVAGGEDRNEPLWPDSQYTGEVFHPPYLFQGARPSIDGISVRVLRFGSKLRISVTTASGPLHAVTLLRPAALTHHFDNDQRTIELAFDAGGATWPGQNTVEVTAPSDDLGPPGYYTLWAIERKPAGFLVPSVARFVQIQ